MSDSEVFPSDAAGVLEAGRAREKAQTLYYRALAAKASVSGDENTSERLNELHADEQHHLSRLTARLLEMGRAPADLSGIPAPQVALEGWEGVARERETDEVRWYERAVGLALDDATTAVLEEVLETERHHARELRGKWMSA